jgi:hypothetical protein
LLAFSRGFVEILFKVTRSESARGPSHMTIWATRQRTRK